MVATASSSGVQKSSSQCASGYPSASCAAIWRALLVLASGVAGGLTFLVLFGASCFGTACFGAACFRTAVLTAPTLDVTLPGCHSGLTFQRGQGCPDRGPGTPTAGQARRSDLGEG